MPGDSGFLPCIPKHYLGVCKSPKPRLESEAALYAQSGSQQL